MNCTGWVMVMTPAQAHINIALLSKAGIFPMRTVGAPGIQAVVTGTQGIGVNTPKAAAVAAATVGLAKLIHIPKGAMLTIGTASMMVAPGMPLTMTRFVGKTFKVLGAAPNAHCIMAPLQT